MALDPAHDPDRYDPGRNDAANGAVTGPLDPAADPDRYREPTLPELLGKGSFEDERDNLTWVFGLLGVIGFLALVSALIVLGRG